MTSGGAEALTAAIRRSLALIAVCVALGAVAVNVIRQAEGPSYDASARVLIQTTPISRIVTGTEPPFVDPQRAEDTARSLASAPEIYQRAAAQDVGLGTPSELRSAVRVTGGSGDILVFTASSSDPDRAVKIANAVAAQYIAFRTSLTGESIDKGIAQLKSRLATLGPADPARAELQNQLTKLELLQTLNSGDAVLVERAGSASKTTPAPVRDSLLGAAIGLIVGLLLAALREAVDTKVRSESDVEDLLAAPVLASVRSIPRRARLVVYGRHEHQFADTYALLAANLFQSRDGAKRVVLAVTSAIPREGKTTTAANLAVALARRGHHVLLADFDFRKPKVSELFGIPSDAPGTIQVLSGEARLEDALWSVALKGPQPRVSQNGLPELLAEDGEEGSGNGLGERPLGSLHVLPAGGATKTHAVAQSPRLATLLKRLRSRYEVIVLDTPPALMTVEMTELGRLIDTALVVVRQGRVSQRNLRALGKQARGWPAEVVGAVLTDTPAQEAYSSYYGGR